MSKNYSSPAPMRGNFVWLPRVAAFTRSVGVLRSTAALMITALCMALGTTSSNAQTTLINAATDGGFEGGAGGFAANGWTVVNGSFNTWNNSAVGTPFAGAFHGFISNDGGVTHTYSNVTPATNHFYKDVVIPGAETIITLSFQHKMIGENGFDRLLVYAAPISVTPAAGLPASTSTVLAGATLLFTQTSTGGVYTASPNITVPATFAGTTTRLIFTWQNDNSVGTNPPTAIDNINLVSAAPANFNTSTFGGLWSSPASWAGGIVPSAGNDVTVVAGSTLTVDAATYNVRDITVDGLLNFAGTAATANNLTITRDLIVSGTGTLLAHNTSVNQSAGVGLTIGRHFTMNGTANLACTNITFNGNGASGVTQNMSGTGTFYGTNGSGKGLIRALLAANLLGTVNLSTTQTIVAYSAYAATGVTTFNTGNRFEISLGANFDGQAVNQSVYEVVMTNHGAGYTSAPTVTIAAPPVGTTATAVANFDLGSGTVRSVTVTVGGTGYRTFNPAVTFAGGGFTTAAAATAVVPCAVTHGNNLALGQRGTAGVITGTMPVTSNWGVSCVTNTSGLVATPVAAAGVGYLAAPTVGFSGPTGLNLVTALGAGYTGAPTAIAVAGATNVSGGAYVLTDFTYVVANGQLVSCILNNVTKTYDVAPTITLTIPGGAGATVAFPATCWPAATANMDLPNGMVTGYTVTNSGFGYLGHPTTGVTGGAPSTAAVPQARCGFYTLNYTSFNPPGYPTPITEGPEMPASRALFSATFNNLLGTNINLNGGSIEFYSSPTPLTFTSGQVNMNGNNITFRSPAYAGIAGGLLNRFYNVGTVQLESTGAASLVRTAPIGSGIGMNPGSTPVAFTSGNNITRWLVNRGTPSGATATGANAYRVRPFNAVGGVGVYGLNPVMTLNWNGNDALISDQPSLTVSQSTAFSGPWTIRSIPSGVGALPATGSRATATAVPGPFVPTGDDYFSFTTTFVASPLVYDVTRTTGVAYTSIVGMAGTNNTIVQSNDDNNYTATLTGTTFTFGGQPVTSIVQNNNGHLVLNGGIDFTSSWLTNIGSSRRVISPFWDDLVAPAAAGTYGGWRVDGGALGSGTAIITFEWKNEETFVNPGPNLNFQVKLYEGSNNIEFIYGVMQGFDGTISGNGAYCYSYACGLINSTASTLDAQPGQALLQQEENTRNFSAYGGAITNRHANYMSSMPECNSSILFTAGAAYTPYVPGSGVPINDDPAGAIPVVALLGPPADLCGTYHSSRGASATGIAAPVCSPLFNNTDDDVWFSFQCIAPTSTVKVYSAGGYDAYVEIFDDAGPPFTLTGVPGVQVFCQNAASEGATETVNATGLTVGDYYYARVFHKHGGIQATATATIAGGQVTAINITNPGSGYMQAAFGGAAPTQYATPRINIIGGLGRNAVAQVFEGPTGFPGTNSSPQPISSVTLMNGGGGYVIPPTVKIDAPNSGVTGDFAITIFATPVPPVNDDICGAIAVVPAYSCTLLNGPPSSAATATNPPTGCGGIPDDDVWFSFVAVSPFDHVEAIGTGAYNMHMEIFSTIGTSCLAGDLTSIACINASGAGQTEQFNGATLIPGDTYFVRLYHTGTGGSTGAYQYCITTPPCGFPGVTGLVQTAASLTSVTVDWTNDPMSSCNYEWEVVPLGNAQGVGVITSGAIGASIVAIPGLTQDTPYTVWVRSCCPLGFSNWTSLAVSTAYCTSAASLVQDEDILNVTLGSLNNSSTCATTGGAGSILNLYSNYTGVAAPLLLQGTVYPISISIGTCGGNFTSAAAAYIDLNEDGDLLDAGEQVFLSGTVTSSVGGTIVSGNVTIPSDCAISGTTRMRVVAVETGVPASISPCGTYLWGETEDYTVDIVAPAACAGAPPVANVLSDANPVCSGSNFTLSLDYLACGLSYAWEFDNGGGWTAIGGNTPTLTTSVLVNTDFRCQVTCLAGPTTTQSAVTTITINTDQCICGSYCANPTSSFTCDEYIGTVTFNTINNNSPVCSGHYQDFTGISTTISAGGSYPIQVLNGGNIYAADQVSAFFDWNLNGLWNEAGETVVLPSTDGGLTFNGIVTVPCTATPGIGRMRIRMNFGAAAIPCLNQSWGEAEDYCVNVLAGIACSGTPTPGASVSDLASVCSFDAFSLSLSPALTDCGLTYQWQSSANLGGPYVAIGGGTTQIFSTSQSTATYYRCLVTCTNSGFSATSTPVQVTMNSLISCLCVSAANFTQDEDIWNVSIESLSNTSTCATTGGPGSTLNAYSNYTALPAPVLGRNANHNFCVTIGTCGGNFTTAFKIFFDFNQDGDLFDVGEEAYVSSTFVSSPGGTTISGSVNVPATATLGLTAMRVVCVETGFPAGISGCGTYNWGETEDYAVTIAAAPSNDSWTTPQVTPLSGSAYPVGNCYNHTLVGASSSPQANPANVNLCGGGADRWYSFTAASTAYRVTCTTGSFNAVLEMTDAFGTPVDAENAQAIVGGENMVTGGLTVGNVYKVAVRTFDGAVGPFTVCVQALLASYCDDGPGVYSLCTNFKPDWTGANNYTFNFTPTVPTPGVPTSVTSPSSTTLSNPALGLRYGGTYDVTIDANYILFNAAGAPDNITVPGAVCPISIIAQPDVQVKLQQRCNFPASLLKGSVLSGKPFACGATFYTVEATQLNGCAGTAIGLPFTGVTSGASSTINLAAINVGGVIQGGGKWYSIRWQPQFSYGPGSYGTPQVIFVTGAVMEEDQVGPLAEEERMEDIMVDANLYPNPNNGDMVNLNIANVESDNVFVNITDMNGRIVYQNRYTVDGSLSTIVTFAQPLAAGMYNVQFIIGSEILNEKLMVQK